MNFPIRLNKYISEKQIASRRMADKLITAGKVRVNGRAAVVGEMVSATDKIEVDAPTAKKIADERIYLAYYKPKGVESHHPELKLEDKVFPIGRLDKNSHGILILTNDGRVTDRMLNPKYEHEKEYVVTVDKKLRPGFLEHMRSGIRIDDYTTKPAQVTKLSDNKFRIILTEGKHHQIRRMCDAFAFTVRDLKRVRIMDITMKNIQPNKYRKLAGAELKSFLTALSLN